MSRPCRGSPGRDCSVRPIGGDRPSRIARLYERRKRAGARKRFDGNASMDGIHSELPATVTLIFPGDLPVQAPKVPRCDPAGADDAPELDGAVMPHLDRANLVEAGDAAPEQRQTDGDAKQASKRARPPRRW